MEEFLLSKSTYNLFESCNRKFYYNFLEFEKKFDEKSVEIMQYGTDFHKILEKMNKAKANNIIDEIEVPAKFKKLVESYKRIEKELEGMGFNAPILFEETIIAGKIKGIIDVAYSNKDESIVIDYKTVLKMRSDVDKYKTEMMIYAYLFNSKYNVPYDKIKVGIEMFKQVDGDADLKIISFSEKDVAGVISKVEEAHNFISTHLEIDDYKKVSESKTGMTCSYCEFYQICK